MAIDDPVVLTKEVKAILGKEFSKMVDLLVEGLNAARRAPKVGPMPDEKQSQSPCARVHEALFKFMGEEKGEILLSPQDFEAVVEDMGGPYPEPVSWAMVHCFYYKGVPYNMVSEERVPPGSVWFRLT